MFAAIRRQIRMLFLLFLLPSFLTAQSTYTAQLSGVVTDSSGSVGSGAKVLLGDDATGIVVTTFADDRGTYVFTGLRPGTYSARVEANNFATVERKGVVIAVGQQATIDVVVTPGAVSSSVTVTTQTPLLDTANASLGSDVTNEYVWDIPLTNRSFFGLVFLAGGVTETAGQGTEDSYPAGINFVSNGQPSWASAPVTNLSFIFRLSIAARWSG
jgi:Carboxypeptidase regulatory-like domain